MNRPGYRAFVEWIAHNDENADRPGDDGAEERASEYITTAMVADLFGVEPTRVARDIMRVRTEEDK